MEFDNKVGAFDDEGLVAADKEKKDWKGIVISLLVIGNIMGAIIVAIILCTPNGDLDLNKSKLDFDMLVSDQFKLEAFNGSWIGEHEIVYVDQNGSIVIFDAETNKSSSMLVKTSDKTLHLMAGFKLSADRQSMLFVAESRHEFGSSQHSSRYAIFNISSQVVEFLDDSVRASYSSADSKLSPTRQPRIQFANWGKAPNSIVFVESNDIYYVPDFSIASARPIRLTRTGGAESGSPLADEWPIRNGLPNNLYKSSIFKDHSSEATLWFSPDAHYLAYLTFNDSLVEQLPIEFYDDSHMYSAAASAALSPLAPPAAETGRPQAGPGGYSPQIHYARYPRAGRTNPTVTVHVADLSSAAELGESGGQLATVEIEPPPELVAKQRLDARLAPYVTYVDWLDLGNEIGQHQNQLLVMWSNRAQTTSLLSLCANQNERGSLFGNKEPNWKCQTVTTFTQRIPPSTDAKRTILSATNSNGTRLIFFALPRPDSVIGDHFHVAMLRGEERAPKYLTYGEFDADRLISYDQASDSLYFEAKIADKAERHLYRIGSIGTIGLRHTKCLTCELDEPCGYNYAHVSPKNRYLVHECLGPGVPAARLRLLAAPPPVASGGRLAENSSSAAAASGANNTLGQQVRPLRLMESLNLLGVSQSVENLIKSKQMPLEKFIAIRSNQQVPCDVYMKLYLPTEIEEEKDKRFPLLIESSEIDSRNVWKRFDLDWGKYLASKKQIIYARLDCARTKANHRSAGSSASAAASASSYMPRQVSDDFTGRLAGGGGGVADSSSSPLISARDQVEAIKFLLENVDMFPYIDRRRVAIYGPTSTSAYMALASTINDDSKLIQCTIAVAPITNWLYMSSYAAEHYLGLPWLDANSLRYEQANLLKRSYEFSMRKLLIVHGTADEQVHVQHSMQLIKSLTEQHITGGALHQMQLYPDVGHSLEQVKRHLYLTLDSFVDRCFYQKPIAIKATEWKGKVRPKLY